MKKDGKMTEVPTVSCLFALLSYSFCFAYFFAEWHILATTLHLLAWSHCHHCGHCFELLMLLLSRAVFCLHQKTLRWSLGHHQKVCWCKRYEDNDCTPQFSDGRWRNAKNRNERSWKGWSTIPSKIYYLLFCPKMFNFTFAFPAICPKQLQENNPRSKRLYGMGR